MNAADALPDISPLHIIHSLHGYKITLALFIMGTMLLRTKVYQDDYRHLVHSQSLTEFIIADYAPQQPGIVIKSRILHINEL